MLAALGEVRPARGGSVPYGIDEIVNNPALDLPERTTQSEPSLAVHGSTVCAGYNNTRRGAIPNPIAGFARSADGGATWIDQGITGQLRFSDPVIAVHHATGTFYYASIAASRTSPIVGVARSTDDCKTFPRIANATPSASLHDLQDKPWIAVDNSGGPDDGNIYACWTRFVNGFPGPANSEELHVSRSTDGGVTFGDEQVLAADTEFPGSGCHLNVGPHGEVYLAWENESNHFPVQFRKSLDGGHVWAASVQVNAMPVRKPGTDRVVICEPGVHRTTLNGDIRTLVAPWMAVDTTGGPFNGNIYMVWATDPAGAVDNSDVFFSRSTDGGATWSVEMQQGGGTETDQFLPVVDVGGRGTVSIAWYDRRNDPVHNLQIEVYATISRDGGATFDPLVRISDVSFPVPPLTGQPSASGNFDAGRSACYMGDYIAIAADAEFFYYAWGDNRDTVRSANYPDGRPDPDVFFERRLVSCGDGMPGLLEQCDDGNLVDGDGCDSNCTSTGCGNGVVTAGEQCDDGNLADGDGCDTDCRIGPIFTPTPTVPATLTPTPTATPSPTPRCAGDCNLSHTVTADELLSAVRIALGASIVSACESADANGDTKITVDEILLGVRRERNGCP